MMSEHMPNVLFIASKVTTYKEISKFPLQIVVCHLILKARFILSI